MIQQNMLEKFAGVDRHSHPHHQLQAGVPADQPIINIIHQTRRDGGVMNCLMDLVMTTGIIVGQLKVLLSCLLQLQLISGKGMSSVYSILHIP